MAASAWDAPACWFCLTKRPEYVLEYGEDGAKHPSFACCRWCTRLLQILTDDSFAVSNKFPTKKRGKRKEILQQAAEHAELLAEIQEHLNATT